MPIKAAIKTAAMAIPIQIAATVHTQATTAHTQQPRPPIRSTISAVGAARTAPVILNSPVQMTLIHTARVHLRPCRTSRDRRTLLRLGARVRGRSLA